MVWLGTQGASAFAKDGWHASLAQQRHLVGSAGWHQRDDHRPVWIWTKGAWIFLGIWAAWPSFNMLHHFQWQNQDIPKPSLTAPALEAKDLKLDLSHFVLLGWRESGELWEPALQYEIDRNPRCNGRTPKNSNLSGTGWIFRRVIPRDHGRWSWVYTLLCWVVSTSFNYQGIFKHGPHLGRWSKWLVVGVVWITSLN